MATQTQVQDTILSTSYLAATLTEANRVQLAMGNTNVSWDEVRKLNRNVNALQIQYDWDIYSSWAIYNCCNDLVGFDTTINSLDPHYQIPESTVEIVNPAGYISPFDPIDWSDLDSATENPDGNRSILIMPTWKGFNPVLSLTSPAETALRLGVDYTLLSIGGIQLLTDLSGAGSPGISDGMTLRSSSYQLA